MKRSYVGRIGNGKMILPESRRLQMLSDISKMKEGREVEIIISPLPRRSNKQNAYMWACVVPVIQSALQDLGHEVNADQTHELLKAKFNPVTLADADGEYLGEIGGSTTEMSKGDFINYLEKIAIWAATYLHIVIPPPESQTELFNQSNYNYE